MKRFLIIGGVGLVAVLVILAVVTLALVNFLARKGIEAGATYALGVNTTLGSARIGIFSGEFGMSRLKVANPEGFAAPHFLALGDAGVAVSLASLTKDTIEVPKFALDEIDVHIERKDGKSNYKVILDNLEKLSGKPDPGKPKPAPKPAEEGKKLIIRELTIRKVTVHVDMLGVEGATGAIGDVTGASAKVTVPIDEIKLKDVGKTGTGVGGSGVTIGELSSIIVQAIMAAVVENGGDLLPKDLLNDIGAQLGDLTGLADVGLEVGGEVVDVAGKFGQEAAKVVEGVAGEAGKAVEELGKGLEGLLGGGGGDKNKAKKPGGP